MTDHIISDHDILVVLDALTALPDDNPKKTPAVDVFHEVLKWFAITGTDKGEVAKVLLDDESRADEITDCEMDWLTSKMADSYCGEFYWDDMEIIGYGIKTRIMAGAGNVEPEKNA
jgi:hypothetical protein